MEEIIRRPTRVHTDRDQDVISVVTCYFRDLGILRMMLRDYPGTNLKLRWNLPKFRLGNTLQIGTGDIPTASAGCCGVVIPRRDWRVSGTVVKVCGVAEY